MINTVLSTKVIPLVIAGVMALTTPSMLIKHDNVFQCPNDNCQEQWDTNSKNGLVPNFYIDKAETNYWIHINPLSKDCPQCNDDLSNWIFSTDSNNINQIPNAKSTKKSTITREKHGWENVIINPTTGEKSRQYGDKIVTTKEEEIITPIKRFRQKVCDGAITIINKIRG